MKPRLLIITPNRLHSTTVLERICELAADPRIGLIIREPDASTTQLETLFHRLEDATAHIIMHTKTPHCANILETHPHWGIHLPATACPTDWRSKTQGPLGQSTHTVDEAHNAFDQKADYVTLSPVYTPHSKPLDERKRITLKELSLANEKGPTFALGGINPERYHSLLKAGIYGAAVLGDMFNGKRKLSTYFQNP